MLPVDSSGLHLKLKITFIKRVCLPGGTPGRHWAGNEEIYEKYTEVIPRFTFGASCLAKS